MSTLPLPRGAALKRLGRRPTARTRLLDPWIGEYPSERVRSVDAAAFRAALVVVDSAARECARSATASLVRALRTAAPADLRAGAGAALDTAELLTLLGRMLSSPEHCEAAFRLNAAAQTALRIATRIDRRRDAKSRAETPTLIGLPPLGQSLAGAHPSSVVPAPAPSDEAALRAEIATVESALAAALA